MHNQGESFEEHYRFWGTAAIRQRCCDGICVRLTVWNLINTKTHVDVRICPHNLHFPLQLPLTTIEIRRFLFLRMKKPIWRASFRTNLINIFLPFSVFRDMHKELCRGRPGLCDQMKPTKGADLLKYLRKVDFKGELLTIIQKWRRWEGIFLSDYVAQYPYKLNINIKH